jgi:ribosomal protein S18 acetylase RimI-like enzyme
MTARNHRAATIASGCLKQVQRDQPGAAWRRRVDRPSENRRNPCPLDERRPDTLSDAETRMAGEILIRPVHGNELAAVLQMWRMADVTPRSVSDSIEGLSRLISEPGAVLLVATIDEQIVGSVIGGWDGWRGNIYRLAIVPEQRRRGIARRLVAEISSRLFAKGATRIAALVEHEHAWAIGFWDSVRDLGYQRDPKFARYIADRIED